MEDYDELFGSFIRKGVWMVCAQTGPEEVECLVRILISKSFRRLLFGGYI